MIEFFIGLIIIVTFIYWIKEEFSNDKTDNNKLVNEERKFDDKADKTLDNSNYSYNNSDEILDYSSSYNNNSSNNKYLKVHTSETGLVKKLLKSTGSKRVAKDILVKEYGYSQSEAKKLVGYRGY